MALKQGVLLLEERNALIDFNVLKSQKFGSHILNAPVTLMKSYVSIVDLIPERKSLTEITTGTAPL